MEVHEESLVGMAMADLANKRLGDGALGLALLPRARAVMDLVEKLEADIAALETRDCELRGEAERIDRERGANLTERAALRRVIEQMHAGPNKAAE